MRNDDRDWMAYVDSEVRAACESKGWGHQIRRKWSVREKPVSESPIDDYEWKLIPDALGMPRDTQPDDFDGVYYLLRFDKANGRFVVQHDTSHCGIMGPHWELETYTEICPVIRTRETRDQSRATLDQPAAGWLRDHLLELTTRFGPNNFSVT